jgi:hypothetical protein
MSEPIKKYWSNDQEGMTPSDDGGWYRRADVDALIKELTWTTDKPTVPGWYWWKYKEAT